MRNQRTSSRARRAWRRLRRAPAKFRRDELGSTMLETALGLSVMLTMVMGVVEFSLMGYTYSVYADGVRTGVRYAITHGNDSSVCSGPSTGCTDPSGNNVSAAVTSYVSSFTAMAQTVSVNVTYPDASSAPPSRVLVSVSYTYKPLFHLPGFARTFSASSAGRVEY